MEHPLKKPLRTGTVGSILAALFRTIIHDCRVETGAINRFLSIYAEKVGVAANSKDISNIRGSLNKELSSTSYTWRVFIKGIQFLNVNRFEIGIKLHHANGKITVHRQLVNLEEFSYQEDDEVNEIASEYNGPTDLTFEKTEEVPALLKPKVKPQFETKIRKGQRSAGV